MSNPRVFVRYCGGCNPRYDRVALLARLTQRLPALTFVLTPPFGDCVAAVVIAGCPAACAGVADLLGAGLPLIRLNDPQDLACAHAALCAIVAEK